ncbi:DUF222 domain-containing protein, partial [uncultured Amnibacterium sp.]|uniref:DUF222 domain-containing protein n=1 Tax=uncultured Amnibacterium sp. TaxID=1631851 RepID=UPI0035CAE6AB
MWMTRVEWRAERDAALARDAARRAGATIRPLRLPGLAVDPLLAMDSEPVDAFWRSAPPAEPAEQVQQVGAVPAVVPEAVLWAQVTGLPRVPGEGGVRVGRRWWMDRRQVWPTLVVQTLLAKPARGQGAHAGLAAWDSESRGWALLALGDAGLDPAAWAVTITLTEWADVPPAERATLPSAPNAQPDPDPLFAALDDVEDVQRLLQVAEVRRVNAAIVAWRAAKADEDLPGAANTSYQKGFFIDLGMKLKVADTTAQTLVTSADRLERTTPEVWRAFQAGKHPWRAMQIVHTAIADLDPALLPAFDEGAVRKLDEVPLPRLAEALRRLVERLQPSTADERHDRAAARRHVTVEPAADGMGWLHAYLPMTDLLGLDHQLTKAAVGALGAAAVGRGIRQLQGDVLRDALRGFLRRDADPAAPDVLVAGRRGVEARISILIPAMTVLGHA